MLSCRPTTLTAVPQAGTETLCYRGCIIVIPWPGKHNRDTMARQTQDGPWLRPVVGTLASQFRKEATCPQASHMYAGVGSSGPTR